MTRVGSLCTGYGGIELGLGLAGVDVDLRWIAEIDPALAPAFAEWLMCLPAGHVTAKLDRVPALRAIGNGVCPPQLAAAWELLT